MALSSNVPTVPVGGWREISVPLRLEFNEHYDVMTEDECLLAQKQLPPDGKCCTGRRLRTGPYYPPTCANAIGKLVTRKACSEGRISIRVEVDGKSQNPLRRPLSRIKPGIISTTAVSGYGSMLVPLQPQLLRNIDKPTASWIRAKAPGLGGVRPRAWTSVRPRSAHSRQGRLNIVLSPLCAQFPEPGEGNRQTPGRGLWRDKISKH